MSITFRFSNDNDKSVKEEFECYMCDGVGCKKCNGTGKVIFVNSQWEMNVANGNAYTILGSLGLPLEECGQIHPNVVLAAINRTSIHMLTKQTIEDGNMITCGVDYDRASRYLTKLKEIATEAAKREEWVQWS